MKETTFSDIFKDLGSMNAFKGPLGSSHNYIIHIVLPNCVDYFGCLKKARNSKDISTPTKFQIFRFFINAIESANNILDYIYHKEKAYNEGVDLKQFRKEFHKSHPFLKDVENYANAYKHCIRGRANLKKCTFDETQDVPHAKDFVENKVDFKVGMRVGRPLVEFQYSFEPVDNEELLNEVFQFCINYTQK